MMAPLSNCRNPGRSRANSPRSSAATTIAAMTETATVRGMIGPETTVRATTVRARIAPATTVPVMIARVTTGLVKIGPARSVPATTARVRSGRVKIGRVRSAPAKTACVRTTVRANSAAARPKLRLSCRPLSPAHPPSRLRLSR